MTIINVLGAGLAGSECALQLAKRGLKVRLFEMKPQTMSPAHTDGNFAELVCSNSLKSDDITSACGLLKAELRLLGSELLKSADAHAVPAGGALAVDRKLFAADVTEKLRSNPNIEMVYGIADSIPQGEITVVATGPLTHEKLLDAIRNLTGGAYLHFFDAAAPIITKESIDFSSAFIADRYGKGTDDYINCPLDKNEFEIFYHELISAETAHVKDFEEDRIFEGCMPIEVMAKRGVDTIRYGPMKPVGLKDPKTGLRPYAVLQLRKENSYGSLYNLVGFQTHLTFTAQKRVFGLIPALKNAEFVRYGVMHKNTYINAPDLLNADFSLRSNPGIYFAGQISGVEGYVESIASGMTAALSIVEKLHGKQLEFSGRTMTGAIAKYISTADGKHFQPMNANFGILDGLEEHERDKQKRKQRLSLRATDEIEIWRNEHEWRKETN